MSRTERLRADLERGFEALEAGELDAAASIVERCRRIDRKNPDVVALAAAVADPDAALDTLATAFDFIDDEDDLIEAIYVKTQALIARGEPAAAREALGELASSMIEDGDLALDLAELALAAEDAPAAQRWIESAQAQPGMRADALHLLGRVHE